LSSSTQQGRSPFEDGELYDVLFGDFRFDLDFYLELAREARGPVLEIACGTGRVLIPCLQAGADIDGLDLFPAMLEVCRRKAAALGLAPQLHAADMRSFSLPRRYGLITIPFNGFVHSLTAEDQLNTLRACHQHLLPGGKLVFNIFYPGPEVLNTVQGTPVLEHETRHPQTGRLLRLYDTRRLDRINQIQYSECEIQEVDDRGQLLASHKSTTEMRWTFKPEMELLLRAAGFARWEIYGDFNRRPIEKETDLMIVAAWRSAL